MKTERFSNVAAMALLCIVPRVGRVARLVCLLGLAWLAVAGGRATTYNIGVRAHATASSEKEPASNAVDGRIRVNGSGAWVSASTVTFWGVIDYPWIQLDWDESVVVSKVLLYDIPGEQSHTAGGELVFDDGSRVLVRAIPDNGAPCVVEFPAKRTRSLRFEVTDGNGSNLGLSEIEVYGPPSDCLTAVDSYIETTRGRYFFFATGSQPFGMISAAPLTRNKNQGGGGYNYNDNVVLGFPQVHAWMLSGLCLMPTTGSVDAGAGESAWKSAFSHDGEIVQPAYHRLFLDRYNVWVEQTNTDRASLYRMTFTEADDAAILLNLGGYVGTSTMVNAHVTKVEGSRIAGYFDTTGRLWGGPDVVRMFFAAEFSRPFDALRPFGAMADSLVADTKATPRNEGMSYSDAPVAGVSACYKVEAGEQLMLKMAVSYTGLDNAERNLGEIEGFDFDATRAASQREWNDMLGRIDVSGGTEADRVKFYTDLWHTLLGRHKLDDRSGDYPDYTRGGRPDGKHVRGARLVVRHLDGPFHMYNSDALWLSQWNLNIIWGLAYPDVLDDFAASFLQYSLNGGLLARGPCAGAIRLS